MPITIKPYLHTDQLPTEQYPSYLPTDYQYASLPPNVAIDEFKLPLENRYDPWEAVAAQVRRKYPQQERPIPLLGTGGAERYQTWPERTIRSALTLPLETYQGIVQSGPGLRREDVTDIPGTAQPLDPLMERAQDVAGLAGGTMFAGVPKGAATLGAGPVKALSETSKVGAPLAALEKAPMFYSAVENAVKGAKQNVADKGQWLSYLKNQQGVKSEEMQWTGLDNLPEGKITKQQLEQHIAENKVQFKEILKLPELTRENAKKYGGETKFGRPDLVLPGGENYRELLLQLPQKIKMPSFEEWSKTNNYGDHPGSRNLYEKIKSGEAVDTTGNANSFRSSHWDEPNVLAHIRMNDREIPNVGKSLHIEEIQSDWHQKGRKEGYKVSEAEKNRMTKELQDIQKERSDILANLTKDDEVGAKRYKELNQKEADLTDKYNQLVHDAVPDAPFKKTWDELAIKRVIRQAVEEGKDAISWTPGEAQAARYDLSKHVDYIHYDPKDGSLWAGKGMNRVLNEKNVKPNELEKYIGKEAADKIINNPTEKERGIHILSGEKLKVGGEGMKGFYDKMMVDKVNSLSKKYGGGKVDVNNLPFDPKKIIRDDVKPDQIAQDKYKDAWDAYVKEINRLTDNGKNYKAYRSNEVQALQSEMNGIHDLMVNETVERLKKETKGDPIHVLKLTPELKEAALTKGFALFSETSKVGAPLSALEKSGMTPEIKSRIIPAIKNYKTGKIETVSRGKSHEELMMNYHQKSGGNSNARYMDIVNNGLKNNETGYYDPKTKQFYNRDRVSDLESTELMTPAQLKKYEQNKVLWSSGLQFPKPIEQPSFNERWNERMPSEMQNEETKGIQPFPTNYTPPERFLEKRPVRLTKMPNGFNPWSIE